MKISTRELVLAALFTAIISVLSIMVRSLQPVVVVPFSLQPLVVMLAACFLSPRAAFLSMLAYLLLGLIGMPVFSKPPFGGLAYILYPSFGFLISYPFAAWIQSKLIKKSNLLNFLLAGLVGVGVIYIFGLPYLYLILNFYLGQSIDIIGILKIGFFPFVIFDLLKVVLASILAGEICRRLGIQRETL